MTKPVTRDPIYWGRRFSAETVELSVRWYITYRLSYRDLAAMLAERGIMVSLRGRANHRARASPKASSRRTAESCVDSTIIVRRMNLCNLLSRLKIKRGASFCGILYDTCDPNASDRRSRGSELDHGRCW